jgi:integrase
MTTTYKVRVFEIQKRYRADDTKRARPARYVVRWSVDRRQFQESFKLSAQADSFRSELMSAARKGEAFDVEAGRPTSMLRADTDSMSWFEFAADYCNARWEELAAGSRRNLVRDLSDITMALVRDGRGRPDTPVLGKALRIAFNVKTRQAAQQADIADAVTWAKRHCRAVRDLANPEVFRRLMSALDKTRDGTRAAPDTIRLRRTTLGNAIEYAIEKGLLDTNPIRTVKVRKNKTALREVDSAAVVSPMQARTLLLALRSINRGLVAFFGLMYFAGLRPEEAVNVRKSNLSLPAEGWGEIRLERAVPEISGEWTDSGERNEETSLKHRERHESRTVPCCPELTGLLHEHMRDVGTATDGRLFWGVRAHGRLSSSVYGRAWAAARLQVFTPEVYDSPLARRPYDLRHACVSGWLAAKVESARVAKWAGHSVAVLHKVYAKFIDGGEQQALKRIDEWYGTTANRT